MYLQYVSDIGKRHAKVKGGEITAVTTVLICLVRFRQARCSVGRKRGLIYSMGGLGHRYRVWSRAILHPAVVTVVVCTSLQSFV